MDKLLQTQSLLFQSGSWVPSSRLFFAHRMSGLFSVRWHKALFLTLIGAGIFTGLYGSLAYTVLSVYDRAGIVSHALPLTFQNVTGAWLWGCAVGSSSLCKPILVKCKR